MKIKHIALVALTALALGLASAGVGAPAVASIKGGATGDFHADVGAPAVAASKPTNGGDITFRDGAPAVASSKPGIASGTNIAGVVVAPEPAIAGGLSGGVIASGG